MGMSSLCADADVAGWEKVTQVAAQSQERPIHGRDVMMQGHHHEVEVEVGEDGLEPTLHDDWLAKEELAAQNRGTTEFEVQVHQTQGQTRGRKSAEATELTIFSQ